MLGLYKTKRKREPIVIKEGREVCDCGTLAGLREYRKRTQIMAERQGNQCALCGIYFGPLTIPTFDHESGRGMRGHLRQDAVLDAKGNWINAALCMSCQGIKGSRKYHWIKDGDKLKYVPMSTGDEA